MVFSLWHAVVDLWHQAALQLRKLLFFSNVSVATRVRLFGKLRNTLFVMLSAGTVYCLGYFMVGVAL